jgi:hypothetical protein
MFIAPRAPPSSRGFHAALRTGSVPDLQKWVTAADPIRQASRRSKHEGHNLWMSNLKAFPHTKTRRLFEEGRFHRVIAATATADPREHAIRIPYGWKNCLQNMVKPYC